MRLPDWPRSSGPPLGNAILKSEPADFQVDEELSFQPSGDGPHEYLRVEKTGCNTQWVATQLAKHAGVRPMDVGYAGLKDRNAIAIQWFSVPLEGRSGKDWTGLRVPGVRIVDVMRNRRKLRRGSIASNQFRLRLRSPGLMREALDARLQHITREGVPNYFGAQRFGIDGGNLDLATELFAGARLDRRRREFALSSARAWIFNQVLARRVADGSWNRVLSGELVALDGRGSIFSAEEEAEKLAARCARGEIHPTGPLWGAGDPRPHGAVAELETEVAGASLGFASGLEAAGAQMSRRSLRLLPREFEWGLDAEGCWLSFSLPAGAYATTVVRELFETG